MHIRSHADPNPIRIEELPDEILASIFEAGHSPSIASGYPAQYPIAISHVCRRFRNVALGTPKLWTTLSSTYCEDQLRSFLLRSKAAELCLYLNDHAVGWPHRRLHFFASVTSHAERWRDVQYIHPYSGGVLDLPDLSRRALSSLTSATFMLSDPYDDPRNLESYLAQWHLPSLLHLKTLGIIPPEGWCSSLTTFEY